MTGFSTPFLRVSAVLLVLWGAFTGCRREGAPSQQPTGPDAEPVRPAVPVAALVDAALNRPPGQESLTVLDRLHDPLRIEVEPRENRHDPGQVDTLRTFHYTGLQFTVYDVAGSAKEIMQSITVTDSAYATDGGAHVGMHRQQIRAALGPPDRVTDQTFVYNLSTVTSNQLRIAFEEGRAIRLGWKFYVD